MENIAFIVHTDFKGNSITVPPVLYNFKAGTLATFNPNYQLIFVQGVPICSIFSDTANDYFCRNDDGQGMLRHKLTFAIAKAKRQRILKSGKVSRFIDEEIIELNSNWKHFLINNEENINDIKFNSNFYNATIEELKCLAKAINIYINDDTLLSSNNNNDTLSNNNSNTTLSNNVAKSNNINLQQQQQKQNDNIKMINTIKRINNIIIR